MALKGPEHKGPEHEQHDDLESRTRKMMEQILVEFQGVFDSVVNELNAREEEIPKETFIRMLEASRASYDIETIGSFDCLRSVVYSLGWEESLLPQPDYESSLKRHLATFDFIKTRCEKTDVPKMLDIVVDINHGHIGLVIDAIEKKIWHKQGSFPITITDEDGFRDGRLIYYSPPDENELKKFLLSQDE